MIPIKGKISLPRCQTYILRSECQRQNIDLHNVKFGLYSVEVGIGRDTHFLYIFSPVKLVHNIRTVFQSFYSRRDGVSQRIGIIFGFIFPSIALPFATSSVYYKYHDS